MPETTKKPIKIVPNTIKTIPKIAPATIIPKKTLEEQLEEIYDDIDVNVDDLPDELLEVYEELEGDYKEKSIQKNWKLWLSMFTPFILPAFIKGVSGQVTLPYDARQSVQSNAPEPKVVVDYAKKYFEEHGLELVKTLSKTDCERLKVQLKDNWGKGPDAFKKSFQEDYANTEARLDSIYRTEYVTAQNEGILARSRDAGHKMKQWNAALDERTCPVCGDQLHGTIIPIEEQFSAVVEHKNGSEEISVNGPPAHPNCRCVLTTLNEEDYDEIKEDSAYLEDVFETIKLNYKCKAGTVDDSNKCEPIDSKNNHIESYSKILESKVPKKFGDQVYLVRMGSEKENNTNIAGNVFVGNNINMLIKKALESSKESGNLIIGRCSKDAFEDDELDKISKNNFSVTSRYLGQSFSPVDVVIDTGTSDTIYKRSKDELEKEKNLFSAHESQQNTALSDYRNFGYRSVNNVLRKNYIVEGENKKSILDPTPVYSKEYIDKALKNASLISDAMEPSKENKTLKRADGAAVTATLFPVSGITEELTNYFKTTYEKGGKYPKTEDILSGNIKPPLEKTWDSYFTSKLKDLEFKDPAFSSTSKSESGIKEDLLVSSDKLSPHGITSLLDIEVPKGIRLVDMQERLGIGEGRYKTEKEVLLDKNTIFKIKSVKLEPHDNGMFARIKVTAIQKLPEHIKENSTSNNILVYFENSPIKSMDIAYLYDVVEYIKLNYKCKVGTVDDTNACELEENNNSKPISTKSENNQIQVNKSKAFKHFMGMTFRNEPGKFTGQNNEDLGLHELATEFGYDKLPVKVSSSELDKIIKNDGIELFRGVSDISHKEEFINGNYFAGRGNHGNGIYTEIGNSGVANVYAKNGETGSIIRMALDNNAKVVNESDLVDQLKSYTKEFETKWINDHPGIEPSSNAEFLIGKMWFQDLGKFAILKGYDAMYIPEEKYMLVLNRSKLYVEDVSKQYQDSAYLADAVETIKLNYNCPDSEKNGTGPGSCGGNKPSDSLENFKLGDKPTKSRPTNPDRFVETKLSNNIVPELSNKIKSVVSNAYKNIPELNGTPLTTKNVSEKEYPELKNAFAAHDSNNIYLNDKYFSDIRKMEQKLSKEVESGFHPKGCNTVESIITHELGHLLFDGMAIRGDEKWDKISEVIQESKESGELGKVSKYALSEAGNGKLSEAASEIFASIFHTKEEEQEPVVKKVKDILFNKFNENSSYLEDASDFIKQNYKCPKGTVDDSNKCDIDNNPEKNTVLYKEDVTKLRSDINRINNDIIPALKAKAQNARENRPPSSAEVKNDPKEKEYHKAYDRLHNAESEVRHLEDRIFFSEKYKATPGKQQEAYNSAAKSAIELQIKKPDIFDENLQWGYLAESRNITKILKENPDLPKKCQYGFDPNEVERYAKDVGVEIPLAYYDEKRFPEMAALYNGTKNHESLHRDIIYVNHIGKIDELMDDSKLEQDIVVYSGVDPRFFDKLPQEPGTEVKINSFISSSRNETIAKGFASYQLKNAKSGYSSTDPYENTEQYTGEKTLIEFRLKKGINALATEPYMQSQYDRNGIKPENELGPQAKIRNKETNSQEELILDRSIKFRVIGTKHSSSMRRIILESIL